MGKNIRDYFKGVGIALFLCSLVFAMAILSGLVNYYRAELVFGGDEEILVYPNYEKTGLTQI